MARVILVMAKCKHKAKGNGYDKLARERTIKRRSLFLIPCTFMVRRINAYSLCSSNSFILWVMLYNDQVYCMESTWSGVNFL